MAHVPGDPWTSHFPPSIFCANLLSKLVGIIYYISGWTTVDCFLFSCNIARIWSIALISYGSATERAPEK